MTAYKWLRRDHHSIVIYHEHSLNLALELVNWLQLPLNNKWPTNSKHNNNIGARKWALLSHGHIYEHCWARDINLSALWHCRTDYSSSGANHAEGGWPKDVSVIDPEATQRYRRKVEKDDNYISCVMSTAPVGIRERNKSPMESIKFKV